MMARVKLYSSGICPLCQCAKQLLTKWGIPFDELRVDRDPAIRREALEVTHNARTVPQITIDGVWIGDFDALTALHSEGKLAHLVEPRSA